jgi:hypothetical protein
MDEPVVSNEVGAPPLTPEQQKAAEARETLIQCVVEGCLRAFEYRDQQLKAQKDALNKINTAKRLIDGKLII